MMRNFATVLLFAATLAAPALMVPTQAGAGSQYDGSWSVVVYTSSGPCDPSARFSGQIVNGEISYAYGSLEVTGHVEANGATQVHVIYGSAHGEAQGRMSATSGSGTWTGIGPDGRCAGTWMATRPATASQ